MGLEREVLTTVAQVYMEKYHEMVGVSTFLIACGSGESMTEGIKHSGYGSHLDHGAATVDTDVEGSQELQEIASKRNLYGAQV